MTPEEVIQTVAKCAGWLAPSGNLHPCTIWHHIEGIAEVVPEFKQKLEDQKEDFDRQEHDWIEGTPEGEHPEWHSLEISQDSERSTLHDQILKEAYQLGYVRIGILYNHEIVRVEGLSQFIVKNARQIEEIRQACSLHHSTEYTIEKSNYK